VADVTPLPAREESKIKKKNIYAKLRKSAKVPKLIKCRE